MIAAAVAGLADPITIIDAQRRELLRQLRDVQRAAMAEPEGSQAVLLLEGMALRLRAENLRGRSERPRRHMAAC